MAFVWGRWRCPFANGKKAVNFYWCCYCYGHHLAFRKLFTSLIRNKGSGSYAHSMKHQFSSSFFVLHSLWNEVKKTRQNKRKRYKQKGLVVRSLGSLDALITRITFVFTQFVLCLCICVSFFELMSSLEFVGHRFAWVCWVCVFFGTENYANQFEWKEFKDVRMNKCLWGYIERVTLR